MKALSVLKNAWRNREKLGNANHDRDIAAFQPALLEIQRSPPNPLARWLMFLLLAFVVIAIAWAMFGRVNIVASAEGKIIPSARVQQVQPLEKGVVKALLVSEGEYVKQGQPLIELDTTVTQSDKKRFESDLHSGKLRLAVNQALLALLDRSSKQGAVASVSSVSLDLPNAVTQVDEATYNSLLSQQWLQFQSQLQVLKNGKEKARAEQAATKELVFKLEQTLPIAEKRAAALKTLFREGHVSEEEQLAAEKERIQQVQDLAFEGQRLKQLRSAEAEVDEQINTHNAKARGDLLIETAELQRQIGALEQDLDKAIDIDAKRILYSPATGQVQELAINTVGGVVTEAQQLMLIVPDEGQLEVEAFLENKDIGFVSEGMPAEVKIHTFPFTKYGVIDAEVTNVSDDATIDEKRGLIYRLNLRMAKNTLGVENKVVLLQPGMAVTAELQTGERRIIEFFISPLLKYKNESIRER